VNPFLASNNLAYVMFYQRSYCKVRHLHAKLFLVEVNALCDNSPFVVRCVITAQYIQRARLVQTGSRWILFAGVAGGATGRIVGTHQAPVHIPRHKLLYRRNRLDPGTGQDRPLHYLRSPCR